MKKRLLSVLLVLSMLMYLPMLNVNTQALELEASLDASITVEKQPLESQDPISYQAVVEDEFLDDTVIVTLKNAFSVINQTYLPKDFGEIDVEAVEDLTYLEGNVDSNAHVNKEDFHQILLV